MNWKGVFVFFVTTITGFFVGKWVANFISWLAPIYFNIDPSFLASWFSKKPTISSTVLGYLIYALTAIAMFSISNVLKIIISDKKRV
tara:strand:+ start:2146 stop:2406 length:261 start_codon:yes stop_codon:yes gene_type:complete